MKSGCSKPFKKCQRKQLWENKIKHVVGNTFTRVCGKGGSRYLNCYFLKEIYLFDICVVAK